MKVCVVPTPHVMAGMGSQTVQVGTARIFHPSNCTPQQAWAGTKTRKAEGDNTNAATAQSHVVPLKTVPELTRGQDTPANRLPLFS